jgi:hypothetical protein
VEDKGPPQPQHGAEGPLLAGPSRLVLLSAGITWHSTRNEYLTSLPQGMINTITAAGLIVLTINIVGGQMYLADDVDPHEIFECGSSSGAASVATEVGSLLPPIQLLLVFELEVWVLLTLIPQGQSKIPDSSSIILLFSGFSVLEAFMLI